MGYDTANGRGKMILKITGIVFICCMVSMGRTTAQVRMTTVDPVATGTNIVSVHGNHIVMRAPSAPQQHSLLLMLVGTNANASENNSFDSVAALAGYHVISLDYKNTVITTTCSNSTDSTCFDAFRQEIILGIR